MVVDDPVAPDGKRGKHRRPPGTFNAPDIGEYVMDQACCLDEDGATENPGVAEQTWTGCLGCAGVVDSARGLLLQVGQY